jgi:small-conductance mechanosensitive channel
LFIGIAALAFSIFHGVAMYLSEGLEFEGVIGLGAFILMMIASVVGTIPFKNKKVKRLRTAHKVLMAFTLLIGFAHIVVS